MKRRFILPFLSLASAVILCASLFFAALRFTQLFPPPSDSQPKASRRLITVWLKCDALSPSPWLRAQAAAYQKTHPGISIWLRTASDADMALLSQQFDDASPDILLFAAGESVSPDWFCSLGNMPYLGDRAKSGQHAQQQLAMPLCMAGYALVQQTQAAAVTPAPTSLFGVTPTPDARLSPAVTRMPRESWPGDIVANDRLGAALLSLMQAPAGARLTTAENVQSAFLRDEASAALLTTIQARALQAQGKGMELLCAAPASDIVLFGGVMQHAEAAAKDFLSYLIGAESQQALSAHGLLATRQGMRLYGAGTPILQAVENALTDGWLPNAFTWPAQQESIILTTQALYAAGESARHLLQ